MECRHVSLGCIANSKSDSVFERVGLCQGCSLSQISSVVFMGGISGSSGWGGCQVRRTSISSLLFAKDVVLLDSSITKIQSSLRRFSFRCEIALKSTTSKSITMVLSQKRVDCPLQFGVSVARGLFCKWRENGSGGWQMDLGSIFRISLLDLQVNQQFNDDKDWFNWEFAMVSFTNNCHFLA